MIDIFTRAYENLQSRLDSFLGDGVANVIQEVDGPLRAALLLYFVLYGIAILRGVIDEPIMDGVMRMIKLAFVYSIATTAAYNDWVTQPLFHVLPNALTTAISGQETPSVGAAFDEYFSRGGILAQETFKTASPVNPGPYLTGALVYLVTALTAAAGFGVTMIAMIALSLVIALGPIFVACIVFESTRRFFVGWLSQCLNYVLLFALIVTIFQMILSIIADEWASLDGAAQPEAAAMVFVAFSLLGAIFFLATPMIASGISGSASLAVKDFARAGAWMQHHTSRLPTPSLPRWGAGSGGSVSRSSSNNSRRAA